MSVEETFSSLIQSFKTRAKNPLVGSFILAWIGINHKQVLHLFFHNEGTIEEVLALYSFSFCLDLVCPMFLAFSWVCLGPRVSKVIYTLQMKPKLAERELRIADELTIVQKELEISKTKKEKINIDNNTEELKRSIETAKKELTFLENQISSASSEISKLSDQKEQLDKEGDNLFDDGIPVKGTNPAAPLENYMKSVRSYLELGEKKGVDENNALTSGLASFLTYFGGKFDALTHEKVSSLFDLKRSSTHDQKSYNKNTSSILTKLLAFLKDDWDVLADTDADGSSTMDYLFTKALYRLPEGKPFYGLLIYLKMYQEKLLSDEEITFTHQVLSFLQGCTIERLGKVSHVLNGKTIVDPSNKSERIIDMESFHAEYAKIADAASE